MERLTYWNKEYGCWSYHCPSGDAAKCLAKYEDAEEQGRLLILPCKTGKTVYKLDYYYDCLGNEYETCDLFAWYDNSCMNCHKNKVVYIIREIEFELSMLDEIDKTIFLNREAAEHALNKTNK